MTNLAAAVFDLNTAKKITVHRQEHNRDNPYTVISNQTLHDENIEKFSDLGLLTYLLSWSNYHRVCIEALTKRGKDGRDAIRGMLKRLENLGYVKRTQMKAQNGKFGDVVYQIYESPTEVKPALIINDQKAETEQQAEDFQLSQLGFNFDDMQSDIQDSSMKNESTADGFSVVGKTDTNKYYKKISNISSKDDQQNIQTQPVQQTKEQEIINRFPIKIDDPTFSAYLNMSMLSPMISTQAQLDKYLIDFNLNHDQFRKLTPTKRLKNFIYFLIKIHNSPSGQKAHHARLRANGFVLDLPKPESPKKAQKAQNLSRFFDVPTITPEKQEEVDQTQVAETIKRLDGF